MGDAAEITLCNLYGNRNRRFQSRLAEVHAKPRAPDGDVFVFVQIGIRRDVVVLTALVAFHRTKVDEAGLSNCFTAFLNLGGC